MVAGNCPHHARAAAGSLVAHVDATDSAFVSVRSSPPRAVIQAAAAAGSRALRSLYHSESAADRVTLEGICATQA